MGGRLPPVSSRAAQRTRDPDLRASQNKAGSRRFGRDDTKVNDPSLRSEAIRLRVPYEAPHDSSSFPAAISSTTPKAFRIIGAAKVLMPNRVPTNAPAITAPA